MKRRCHKGRKGERGQVLLLVLILMILGGLILTPLLSYMSTGLMSGVVFENKADELYAADSGVEDGLWQIKNDQLSTKFPTYDPYDYYTTNWNYNLNETNGINGKNVNVNIRNMWIPWPKNLTAPLEPYAKQIIEGIGQVPPKIIVTGVVSLPSTYKINIDYYPTVGESFNVTTLGIWLPPGFTYVAGSSNLGIEPVTPAWCSGQAVVWSFSPAVAFTSFPGPPSPLDSPMRSTITFNFTAAQSGQSPAAVPWIYTASLDLGGNNHCAWDADKKVYQITSTAGNTIADAYAIKVEIRKLGSAISGDYYATGNSLMIDRVVDGEDIRDTKVSSTATVGAPNPVGADNGVPQDATVAAAYLYWSAWNSESQKTYLLEDETSPSFSPSPYKNNTWWTRGGTNPNFCWIPSSGYYSGHYTTGWPSDYTYLTLKNYIDLSTYKDQTPPYIVTVSWDQWVSYSSTAPGDNDGLDFALSADNGVTWSSRIQAFRGNIGTDFSDPEVTYQYTISDCFGNTGYLTNRFKIRFYLVGFSASGQYCNIKNIRITVMHPDTGITFSINGNQVYLDVNGTPQKGSQELVGTKSKTQLLLNYVKYIHPSDSPDVYGFSYSCYRDVTALVKAYSEGGDWSSSPKLNGNSHATYSVVGDIGDTGTVMSYAGWSLVIIYQSPDTKGHQLYLYDKFVFSSQKLPDGLNVDWDGDGEPGGTISGFLVPQPITGEVNAAKLTCFVVEGDEHLAGDYLAFEGTKLWDGSTPTSLNNIWNGQSYSTGGTVAKDGIDIDTPGINPTTNPPQYITWNSHLLEPGDTSARIDLYTIQDGWMLVYMILSFRSVTTTGGTITYLIRG